MSDVTAIKVKVFRRPNKHFDYPDLSALPSKRAAKEGGPLTEFMQGGRFDKTSSIESATDDSPLGERWLMKIVSLVFAAEAIAAYPARVFRMTEAEAQDFWDNKAHIHLGDNRQNENELNSLSSCLVLMQDLVSKKPQLEPRLAALREHIEKALDPDDETPGVIANRQRRWATAKLDAGVTFVEVG